MGVYSSECEKHASRRTRGPFECRLALEITRTRVAHQIKTKTFAVRGSQQGNKLTLTVNGQRWTGARTRAGITLNLPKTSSLSLTIDLETATRTEFQDLIKGFRSGVEQRARAVPTG